MDIKNITLIICCAIIVLGMVTLSLFLAEKVKKYSVKATLIKAMTSFLFISTALVAWFGFPKDNQFGLYVIAGLVCGLMGDIWLDFKYVFPNEDKLFTYAGFISFLVGHVFYITGMFLTFGVNAHWLYFVIPLAAGTLLGVGNLVLEKPMKLNYGKMKPIVALYGALLFSMVLSAISMMVYTQFNSVATMVLVGGGVLFAVSDLILSGTYFGEGKERPVDIITNGVTYYLAQFAIAFSLFFC